MLYNSERATFSIYVNPFFSFQMLFQYVFKHPCSFKTHSSVSLLFLDSCTLRYRWTLSFAYRPFFLYVAFHDPHRNPDLAGTFGQFMERWGDGQTGHGLIPDWTPVQYDPEKVKVPYFLPDTNVTRQELANMYTTYSRMDQGKVHCTSCGI